MRIQVAIPEPHVTKPVLDAMLEGVTRLNEELIRSGEVPPYSETRDAFRWKPEPPGAEHFDHAKLLLDRQWGDCDDIAPYKAASDRVTGKDPGARAVVKRSGPRRWHAYEEHSDGSASDPSLEHGMPGPGGVVGIRGACVPMMFRPKSAVVGGTYLEVPRLAMRPVADRAGLPEAWQARVDLPWHYKPGRQATDVAMVSLHKSPVSDQALVGALEGAIDWADASGFADEDNVDRLEAIVDACHGATWDDLCDEYGPEHATAAGELVGSFFGGLLKKVSRAVKHPDKTIDWAIKHSPAVLTMKAARQVMKQAKPLAAEAMPLAQMAAPFIPGIGPLASMAFQMASPMLQNLLQSGQNLPPPGSPYAMPGGYMQQPFGFGMPTAGSPWR